MHSIPFPGDIGKYKIDLNPKAKPTQDTLRTVPVGLALKTEIKVRLEQMTKAGILKKKQDPRWVNLAVYVKIKLCLDPKQLHKYIKKSPKYRMHTLENITSEILKVFTISDM